MSNDCHPERSRQGHKLLLLPCQKNLDFVPYMRIGDGASFAIREEVEFLLLILLHTNREGNQDLHFAAVQQ